MPVTPNQNRVFRFGLYELDADSGELRKDGKTRPRLQGQPLEVLLHLLDRPGELVTREELRQRLWPGNTFVDFDKSVGVAVLKVREALGDSATNPTFLETLPRRGYRSSLRFRSKPNQLELLSRHRMERPTRRPLHSFQLNP